MTKELSKFFNRIERILVPTNSFIINTVSAKLAAVMNKVKQGIFFRDTFPTNNKDYSMRTIDWDALEPALLLALDYSPDSVPSSVAEEIYLEKSVQFEKVDKVAKKFRIMCLQVFLVSMYTKYYNISYFAAAYYVRLSTITAILMNSYNLY